MSHLSDERLTTLAFEPIEPTTQEDAHLGSCPDCRRAYAELATLAADMTIFVQSQPDADTVQRYYRLFDEVPTSTTGFGAGTGAGFGSGALATASFAGFVAGFSATAGITGSSTALVGGVWA